MALQAGCACCSRDSSQSDTTSDHGDGEELTSQAAAPSATADHIAAMPPDSEAAEGMDAEVSIFTRRSILGSGCAVAKGCLLCTYGISAVTTFMAYQL